MRLLAEEGVDWRWPRRGEGKTRDEGLLPGQILTVAGKSAKPSWERAPSPWAQPEAALPPCPGRGHTSGPSGSASPGTFMP